MDVIYRTGLLIDGSGNEPVHGACVWVSGRKIKAVIPPGEALPEGITVLDLSAYSVVPGLTDMHVHTDYWYSQPNVMEYRDNDVLGALLGARNLRSALECGVTTVRDVGSGHAIKMKRGVNLGLIPGARMFVANYGICMTGGHGSTLPKGHRIADGPEDVRKAVREQIAAGADFIKILTSHRTETPEFRQEELDAGVDEAHRLGFRVACHAGLMPAAKMAVQAGVDTVEHGTHINDEVREMMAKRGTYLIPTMIAYHCIAEAVRRVSQNPGAVDDFRRAGLMAYADWWINTDEMLEIQFRKAAEYGLKIAVGTDIVIPEVPFCSVHTEMEMMVQFGYGEMRTICAATRVAAEALGKSDSMGTIAPCKLADLVAVDGNPLENISALRNIRLVVKDGRQEVPAPVPFHNWPVIR